MLLLGSADTTVQIIALVVIVVCLCILAWHRTHPVEGAQRKTALERYRERIRQDMWERERDREQDP
jgi:membrane protein implicated in regulation of membrane protease activity